MATSTALLKTLVGYCLDVTKNSVSLLVKLSLALAKATYIDAQKYIQFGLETFS